MNLSADPSLRLRESLENCSVLGKLNFDLLSCVSLKWIVVVGKEHDFSGRPSGKFSGAKMISFLKMFSRSDCSKRCFISSKPFSILVLGFWGCSSVNRNDLCKW